LTAEVAVRRHEQEGRYGQAERVSPRLRRILAPNPSPFTLHGTQTYIVGEGAVAVIDPGPALAAHVDAILEALRGERVTHIAVTHTHLDHSPAARLLAAASGAPCYGYGPHGSGRLPAATPAGEAVEEGADRRFVPDVRLADGERIEGEGWTLECVHTPGHTANHLCYALVEERGLMCGDHVMGWSTSVIAPPDGDMGRYLASLERLLAREDAVYYPAHGPAIADPRARVRALLAHRRRREERILQCLKGGLGTIAEMRPHIYRDLDPRLERAAGQQLFAALLHLVERGLVSCDGAPSLESRYTVAP